MRCNADRMIECLIKAQLTELEAIKHSKSAVEKPGQTSQRPEPMVVTLSRGYGAMGCQIAHLLAEALELHCCDCLILQEVARRANVDQALVKALDEHVSIINSHFDDKGQHWWKRLINRYSFTHEDYQDHLAKTILSMSLHGGVILGRGANFILGPERAFRVRVVGSVEACARRVADRESISIERATDKVIEQDYERTEYVKKLYDADINNPLFYDLIINTDRYSDVETVEIILNAMQQARFALPSGAYESIGVSAPAERQA